MIDRIRPKLVILGHARHGKDTVAKFFANYCYTHISSSLFAGERIVWAEHKRICEEQGHDYTPFEEFYELRKLPQNRKFWYDTIAAYNNGCWSRLGGEIFTEYDIYSGLRNKRELFALKARKLYALSFWVDASDRIPSEDKSSCTVEPWMADVMIDNNGTLDDLENTLQAILNWWVQPLEERT